MYRDYDCHEAHFGLAKIYYHLQKYDFALESIRKAVNIRPNDDIYLLWKGLILYYYITYKLNIHDLDKDRCTHCIKECEKSLN
jgi:tetratricopeptide (TPR) repeat protein